MPIEPEFKRVQELLATIEFSTNQLKDELVNLRARGDVNRLLHCEDETCRRVFYRRGPKRFCSVLCAQRIRSRNWYREHKGVVSKKQHGSYRRKMQKQSWKEVVAEDQKGSGKTLAQVFAEEGDH